MQRWGGELDGLTQNKAYGDRIRTLADAAARTTDVKTDPYVLFGATAVLSADLRAASIAGEKFLVRVEFETSAGGDVFVSLTGPSLAGSMSFTSGSGRRVGQMIVDRSASAASGVDVIAIKASSAKIFAVSVRPTLPAGIGSNSFEFVSLDVGVTQDMARRLAARSRFNGYAGRLARVTSTPLLDRMRALSTPDVAGWIDGSSPTGAIGSFTDKSGNAVATSLFAAGTSFTTGRPRGAQAFTDTRPIMRLGHGHPGTNVDDRRAGFWIEYLGAGNATSASATTPPSEGGFIEALTAFFTSVSSDDGALPASEDVVADCLSVDTLSCFATAEP